MSLNQLIENCKVGDTKAQGELYKLFSSKLFSVCLKYSRSYAEAEDNLQDAFLKIFDKIEQYKNKGSFEGWLKRITINTVLQRYRNEKVFDIVNENVIEEVELEVDEDAVSIDYLLQIIQELPDRYRLVFNLYVLDGYSHKDIANMLDINIGTSKSNLARARHSLKQTIENYKNNTKFTIIIMSDKKHIDRLFQEGFKDFEATPSDAVWENIEAKLNQKKKKRRVIPIWWRYAGVAALLLLLLTIGGVYFNNTAIIPSNQVTDIKNTAPPNLKKDDSTNLGPVKDAIVNTDSNENKRLDNTSPQIKKEPSSNKILPSKESSIVETSASKNNNESKQESNISTNKKQNAINKLLNTESNHAVAKNLEEKNDSDKTPDASKNRIDCTDNFEDKIRE